MKTKFDYNGFELEIEYNQTPPDDSTGFKGEFEIDEIFFKGNDITDLLEPQLEDIKTKLLKHWEELENE